MEKEQKLGMGDGFMIATVTVWGVNFPVAKIVLGEMSPEVFSATRYFTAALFLFAILILRRERLSITWREAKGLFILGLLGISFFQGFWAFGLSLTLASKASILVATTPIFGAFIAAFTGLKPSPRAWVGIVMSLGGIFILVNNSLTQFNLGGGTLSGDLLILGAAVIWAFFTASSGPLIQSRGSLLVMAYVMLFGSLTLMTVAVPGIMEQDWSAISFKAWISWAFATILGGAFAFLWYSAGFARLGITRAMAYTYLIPVVAVVTSVSFFGETLSLVQIGGAVVVMLGIILSRTN